MTPSRKLKDLVARKDAVVVPGVANAMFGRAVESLGFEALYLTGAGIANMHLGVPDIGLVSVTEVSEILSAVTDAVSIPVIVDADTGFGNAINMTRTVRLFEKAGAAGLQIEDQVFPKKCGHFAGKDVIPLAEMVQKIHAAVDTRRDGDLQIIARTDARAVHGLDAAIERAHAFVAAGADLVFVEAPTNAAELRRIAAEIDAPHVVNIVFGGLTPELGNGELKEMGFSIVLYANAVLQAALKASREVLAALREEGNLYSVKDRLASFAERQEAVNKGHYDALEARYVSNGA